MRTSSATCEDVLAHLPSDRKGRYPVAVDVSSLESAENFNHKPARRAEIECPRPVEPSQRLHVEPVVLQALVDLANLLFALLDEADVESLRVAGLGTFHQRNTEPPSSNITSKFSLPPSLEGVSPK